ncbi:MAG TPA: hypothetical protein VFI59_06110 [Actinomycetota bacterium]|nr:hypothetical protein [Actinomycetota bacterium]
MSRARAAAAASVAAVAVVAMVMPSTAGPAGRGPVPGTTCEVFPADNVWRMDVSALPKHPKSQIWKRSSHAGSTDLHPDFGPPAYGIPYGVVDASHGDAAVDFQYASESDDGPYPFGPDVAIEGGSDRHALMLDRDACTLYELFNARWNGGDPTAGSGAIFDLGSNDLRPAGWTSADAAGLPIFPGLVRWDEVQAGEIDHAIRFTVACTMRRFVWPARHQAGLSDRRCPPMGARFRLRQGFDISGFSPNARVVLLAMQRYGLIVADNGSDWYFQGTVDDGWTNGLLDQLKEVPAGAFVAVDARGCRVSKDSAEFAYGPDCPAPD